MSFKPPGSALFFPPSSIRELEKVHFVDIYRYVFPSHLQAVGGLVLVFWIMSVLLAGPVIPSLDGPKILDRPGHANTESAVAPTTEPGTEAVKTAALPVDQSAMETIDLEVQPGLTPLLIQQRSLWLPVEGVSPADLYDSFDDPRGRSRKHRAIDIMAPRGTPVRAPEGGTIVALRTHRLAGISVYQVGPRKRYSYLYAHLDAWAPGLEVGRQVKGGDLIGFVGTTGNAPESAPHLHLAIHELSDSRRFWAGKPINPYPLRWRD